LAYLPPDTPGLERLYRFDDSTTEVADRTGNSAPVPLATDVTITASDAPTAPDPAPPIAPGPNAEVTAFVYDSPKAMSLSFDDIVLDFQITPNPSLIRRWLHSTRIDEPIAFEEYSAGIEAGSGSELLLFNDQRGSIVQVVDAVGSALVGNYEYDSFGQRVQVVGSLALRYGFTGREIDLESNLYYYRARHYDPNVGSFVQADPVEFAAGSLNIFGYVSANPYNRFDPSGLAGTVSMAQSIGAGATLSGVVAT